MLPTPALSYAQVAEAHRHCLLPLHTSNADMGFAPSPDLSPPPQTLTPRWSSLSRACTDTLAYPTILENPPLPHTHLHPTPAAGTRSPYLGLSHLHNHYTTHTPTPLQTILRAEYGLSLKFGPRPSIQPGAAILLFWNPHIPPLHPTPAAKPEVHTLGFAVTMASSILQFRKRHCKCRHRSHCSCTLASCSDRHTAIVTINSKTK